jgi:hypothetical protein
MFGSNYFLVCYSMGLDLNFTHEQIQRIETDANNADTQDLGALANALANVFETDANNADTQALENTRKRKFRGVAAFQKGSSSN